ncbi:MAG: NADH-quinone oxidoreductase subunit NuoN [Vulcanimicrobiaceae bacterium]
MRAADLLGVVPEMWLGLLAMTLTVLATFRKVPGRVYVAGIAGFAGALATLVFDARAPDARVFGGTYALDGLGLELKAIVLIAGGVALVALREDLAGEDRAGEAPALVAFGTLGATIAIEARDLALIAVALAMLAAAVVGMLALTPASRRAGEAATKFFTFAAFSGAAMLYGFGLFFGLGRGLGLDTLTENLRNAPPGALFFAGVLAYAGIAYEAALVPFAQWAPDVYAGARTSVTLWLSIVPKIVALAVLARVFIAVLHPGSTLAVVSLGVAAALSMTWGNLGAYGQSELKRLLAYSGIAQAGFMAAAIAVAGRTTEGFGDFVFYAAAYATMNGAAFLALVILERRYGITTLAGLAGIGRAAPALGVALTFALLSLAGFPPFVGFAVKIAVLRATFSGGQPWLGIVFAVNTVLALGYYVRPIARIWDFSREPVSPIVDVLPYAGPALALATLANVILGLIPATIAPR